MKIQLLSTLTVALFFLTNRTAHAQGSLTPPGAPAPTMKSLDQVEPRKPIAAPATISQPGSYYLTTNATVAGSGIIITASDVALDLAGFTITGDGGTVDYGVYVNSSTGAVQNISVRNGKFRNIGAPVVVGGDGADDVIIEDIQIKTGTRTGIWLAAPCRGAVIRRNLLLDCRNGVDILAFTNNVISGVTVEANTVSGGDSSGISINAQDGGQIRHVTVRNNYFSDKGGTAIVVTQVGTGVAQRLIFDSNHCSGNGNLGMILPANTQSLVVRNYFVNLTLSTLNATGNTVGPIVNVLGTLGTSGADISPWANIRN